MVTMVNVVLYLKENRIETREAFRKRNAALQFLGHYNIVVHHVLVV